MPNISALPLMPGADSLRPEDREPAPAQAQRRTVAAPTDVIIGEVLDGCNCAMCRMDRAQASRGELGAFEALVAPVWEASAMAIPDLGAQPFQTVTGRSRASEPTMQDLPRAEPYSWGRFDGVAAVRSQGVGLIEMGDSFDMSAISQHVPSNRIRGRYGDMAAGLSGQVRYREPGTPQVYMEPSGGRVQWTFETELPDGTLTDSFGRRWIPD